MTSLNLDQLLDNDTLTHEEEKTIRRLVKYELRRDKSRETIYLSFSIPKRKLYHTIGYLTAYDLKAQGYKEIMSELIRENINHIHGDKVKDIESILEKNPLSNLKPFPAFLRYKNMTLFIQLPKVNQITHKTLWDILNILIDLSQNKTNQ